MLNRSYLALVKGIWGVAAGSNNIREKDCARGRFCGFISLLKTGVGVFFSSRERPEYGTLPR